MTFSGDRPTGNGRGTVTSEDVRAARLVLARDAWDAALIAGDLEAADRCAAEVAALEADRA